MKKRNWLLLGIIVISFVLLACCFRQLYIQSFQNAKLEILCEASVYAALEHFEEYNANGNDSDYIAGVSEFRAYMRAYLVLQGQSDTNYLWCDTLYGDMTLHPEDVKAHVDTLIEALEYLTEDYTHPNGFQRIDELNNLLRTDA